jgi:hypothetical protein
MRRSLLTPGTRLFQDGATLTASGIRDSLASRFVGIDSVSLKMGSFVVDAPEMIGEYENVCDALQREALVYLIMESTRFFSEHPSMGGA